MTVEALRDGQPDVLAELNDRFGRQVHGVAYLILGDASAADDVVVDTLLRALDRGRTLRDAAALRPWLMRIAANEALGRRRRNARVVQLQVLPELAAPEHWSEADERAMLWQGVTALPLRMRAAVVLRYYADLPVEAVATALGVSPNTIKSQLRVALGHLRAALSDDPSVLPPVEVRHA